MTTTVKTTLRSRLKYPFQSVWLWVVSVAAVVVRWLYRVVVDDLYVPNHTMFAIGMKHPEVAPIWNSFLPDTLRLAVRTKSHGWQSHTFHGDN